MTTPTGYARFGDSRHSQSPTTSIHTPGRKPYIGSRPTSGYSTPGGRSTASFFGGSSTGGRNIGCFTGIRMTAAAKVQRFFRRLVQVRQMDFEFAAWQMVYLLTNPQQVFRNAIHRKRTKDQWARDDPAFLVLLAAALSLTSILFAFVLNLSIAGFIKFFMWIVFVDCIGVGLVIATFAWYLRRTKDQDVEWGYCWDVHLNAFFPMFVFIHVIMPLLFYALPILRKTHIFLYPLTFIFIFFVATVAAGWNISQSAMDFYHFRATNLNRRVY